jgi:anion-transporting  ArsA/GET3 family ATPase
MPKPEFPQETQHLQSFVDCPCAVINLRHPVAMEVDESGHLSMLTAMPPTSDLRELFRRHRALICVGAGGVGKTTVAAAIALLAAQSGLRTLCLTIDPARRLASSLGLTSFPKEEMAVSDVFLRAHGVELAAPLTVMMLDAQATFDSLIRTFAHSEEQARRICEHRVYQHLAKNLAGTQAYMAMEKVLQVMQDDRYDLIVLDTPPSARVLAFFDAPERMTRILASPATRALSKLMGKATSGPAGIFSSGLKRAMLALESVTGAGLVGELAELLTSMNSLLDGFDERARKVQKGLHSDAFGYIAVTAPGDLSLEDAHALATSMRSRSLELDALVFNRVAAPGLADAGPEEFCHPPFGAELAISLNGRRAISEAARAEAEKHKSQLNHFDALLSNFSSHLLSFFIPSFADDVHEPEMLMRVAQYLGDGEVQLVPLPRKYNRSGTDS